MKDLFICGLIGSGKDTTVEYLRTKKNYWKIRNARTIKGVIQDVKGFTNDELEHEKRTKPEIRQMHHDVDAMLTSMEPYVRPLIKSQNRLKLIVQRQSLEFENNIDKFVISDVRAYDEIKTVFENSNTIKGIFLLRTSDTTEYINNNHWTNKLNYNDTKLIDLLNKYNDRCIIVDNQGNDVENLWKIFYNNYNGTIHKIDFTRAKIDENLLKAFINEIISQR